MNMLKALIDYKNLLVKIFKNQLIILFNCLLFLRVKSKNNNMMNFLMNKWIKKWNNKTK